MNNDDIYHDINQNELDMGVIAAKESNDGNLLETLQKKQKRGVDFADRNPRSKEEMAEEADILRPLFQHYENIWES